jgi:MYXO-CTERM domain-containing protein
MTYYTPARLIGSFIDRISKGGSMILNLSPMPDGTIPQQQKDILTAFGTFLRQMGTAIYNTRAWVVYGEGPTKLGGGQFTAPTALTASDVRYTASKDGDAVYAILGGWPGNGTQVTLASVTSSQFALGTGKVFLFGPTGGSPIQLTATQDDSGVHVTLPSTQPYTALAYAMKISKSGTAPAPTPWLSGVSDTDGGVGTGGSDGGAGASGSGGAGGASAGDDGSTATGGAGAGGSVAGSGGTGASGATGGSGQGGSGTGGATTGRSGSSSGCACATGTGRRNPGGVVLLGFAVGLILHRRRR